MSAITPGQFAYDGDNWLVTTGRSIKDYMTELLGDVAQDVTIELSFPNTQEELPLPKTLIHLEIDDIANPVVGFGTPGEEVYDDAAGTWQMIEYQAHEVNYDLGVWASRESGGATHRAVVVQKLVNMFSPPEARKAFREATNMMVVSFSGGRGELDRVADIPIWRMLDMTLVVRVVSRHVGAVETVANGGLTQNPALTIANDTGGQSPVT